MKVGDLVRYSLKKIPASVPPTGFERLGVVVKVSMYQRGRLVAGSPPAALPMATVRWNGIARAMEHRQDVLEAANERR